MIPSNTGSNSNSGCTPISSNCVIWQGPNISCLDLCTGDTISVVIATLAEKICDIIQGAVNIEIGDIDGQCVVDDILNQNIDFENGGITAWIQGIINVLCSHGPHGGGGADEEHDHPHEHDPVSLPVPKCIQSYLPGGTTTMPLTGVSIPLQNGGNAAFLAALDGTPSDGVVTGWGELIGNAVCYILDFCCHDSVLPDGMGGGGLSSGNVRGLASRVRKLEQQPATVYVPPKVTPKYVTNNVGKAQDMNVVLTALENEFGILRQATGLATVIREAIKRQPIALNTEGRLNGTGTMSALPGWYMKPATLGESISNLWITTTDMRNAIKDLQKSTTKTHCSDIVYDFSASLVKGAGPVTGIKLDFTGLSVPSTFSDVGTGSLITIKDASLNSKTVYLKTAGYQNTTSGYTVDIGNLNVTENYEITVDFNFSDGTSDCAKSVVVALANNVGFPTIAFSDHTTSSFRYTASGMSTADGTTLQVITESLTGGQVQVDTYSNPGASVTAVVKGLVAGQTYNVFSRLTGSGCSVANDSTKSSVSTLTATCTSAKVISADYKTATTDVRSGASVLSLLCYNDSVNTTYTVATFDDNNNPVVYKGTTILSGITCAPASGAQTVGGNAISINPTHMLTCGSTIYPATGFSTTTPGGWRYVDTIKGPDAVSYYVYALYDETNKEIDEVVFCCDCSGLTAVTASAGDTIYCKTGGSRTTQLKLRGYTGGATSPTWTRVSEPLYGTLTYNSAQSTSIDGSWTYTNTQTDDTAWTGDSFTLRASNDCGTTADYVISVQKSEILPFRDTNMFVFVDTTSFTSTEGDAIKTQFEAAKTQLALNCPTWTGTIYYIPINGSNAGDYLKIPKALIDMHNGASGSVTVETHADWNSFKSLPPYWVAATKSDTPASAVTWVFTNTTSLNGNYGNALLSDGTTFAPTSDYLADYEALQDIKNATTNSTWGGSNMPGFRQFGTTTAADFNYVQILVPKLTGSTNESAATVLQMATALLGKNVLLAEYNGIKAGKVKFPVNLKPYILDGTAPAIQPYSGNTSAGTAIVGLTTLKFTTNFTFEQDDSFSSNMILDIIGNGPNLFNNGYVLDCPPVDAPCKVMTSDTGSTVWRYSASGASHACSSPSATIEIWNSTGNVFGTGLAFKNQGGCCTNTAAQEIDTGYYAADTGASGKTVALYTKTVGWSGTTTCP